MEWHDTALILSTRAYGEHALFVRVFSREQGVYSGMVRLSKKARAGVQPGNVVEAHWSARLEDQLGSLRVEPAKAFSALIIQDGAKLNAMNAALSLIVAAMPERDPHPSLYVSLLNFLSVLTRGQPEDWLKTYVLLEMELLKELGFGLDLTTCAATGVHENLIYVSPKSGRAVCESAGKIYHDKLLPLPAFLSSGSGDSAATDIFGGLRLTGYFLEKHLLEYSRHGLPQARERLLSLVSGVLSPAASCPLPA